MEPAVDQPLAVQRHRVAGGVHARVVHQLVPRRVARLARGPDARAVVEDSALRGVVADLRDALGEHAAWLQYVARRGYCLAGRATGGAPVPEPAAPAPTLAVLPFTAPGRGAPSLASLGGGLAAAVSDGLGRIEELVVRPFGSVLAHWQAANDASPPEPGLHSRWVLGGQVEQVGTRLHVHAGLRHGADGPWLWRQRFEAERGDAGHLATQIVTRTAAALATQAARPASAAASGADTASAAASEAFHRGRYLLALREPDALRAALQCLQADVGADPHFVRAWAALAECACALALGNVIPSAKAGALAGHAVRQAFADEPAAGAFGPASGEAFAARARVRCLFERNLPGAEADARAAVAADRRRAEHHHALAFVLGVQGRAAEAAQALREAVACDPISRLYPQVLAAFLARLGHFEEACEECQTVLTLDPANRRARYTLCVVHLLAGDAPAALVQAEWLQRSATGDDALQEAAGLALALLGCAQRARARAVLEELSAAQGPTPQRPQGGRLWLAMDRAIVLAALGEPQAALEALEHCVAHGGVEAVLIASEPLLRPLHGHPRFEALLRELGFGRQAAAPRGAQPQYGQ